MTDTLDNPDAHEEEPPVAHVRVVYLGPFAPHWQVDTVFGDAATVDPFRDRAMARLTLLPPHDPQFKRNRERVARDAERERITLDWDLGTVVDNYAAVEEESAPAEP
ncbi:MAG: hypothetical protein ACYCUF_02280 [Acidimicrobiales bacterium]|jgi:hypothetical protein|nr:hypothetical protein [Actinomycetota bacterium]